MGDGGGDSFFSACGCSVVLTSLVKKIVAEQIRWDRALGYSEDG